MAGWRWLSDNPARRDLEAPEGWVLEDRAGDPVAFLGNFPQRFWRGDRRLHAATGFSIIVPPTHRGGSRALIQAFLAQHGCAALYTFNANPLSSPLYGRHGMKPWPPSTHSLKLSWIVDPVACLKGRILRSAVSRAPTLAAMLGESFMNARLWRTFEPVPNPDVTRIEAVSEGSDYERFWLALKAEGRMVADRSPEVMGWRLCDPDRTHPPLMLAYRRGGEILGFAMGRLAKGASIEPAFLEIVDLVALERAPEAIPDLVRAMVASAKSMGAVKVRLQVVSPHTLSALGDLARSARREGGWGHCHLALEKDESLVRDWRPTPYDGDYDLCLRSVPRPEHAWPRRLRPGAKPVAAKA